VSAVAGVGPARAEVPRPVISYGALEAAKWIALVSMTLDHVDTYLLHDSGGWMACAGRLAMPLFGIVLAAHLARPGALEKGGPAERMTVRLVIFGLAAQLPFTLLRGGPWPPTLLNIMFLLLLVVVFVRLQASEQRWQRLAGWCALAVFGAVVEFWWIGAAFVLAYRSWLMNPSSQRALGVVISGAALCVLNVVLFGSPVMALVTGAAPLVVYALDRMQLNVPRVRWVFYAYYPVHLMVLLLLGGGPN
jgi:hypothetical protein